MANIDDKVKDPSQQGVGGLKGLSYKGIDLQEMADKGYDTSAFVEGAQGYATNQMNQFRNTSPRQEIGVAGLNESVYDKEITSATQLDDLQDTRAEFQPWYSKITNGIAKGAVLAGTTFVSGTLGSLVGLIQGSVEQDSSKIWDNGILQGMQQVNEWSEKAIPNYYSKAEREEPWTENVFSANFIGDKFLKNIGFTIGAYYSGKLFTPVIGKALQGMATGAKAMGAGELAKQVIKGAPLTQSITGSLISAVNEGSIEAINNTKPWTELQNQKAQDRYKQQIEAISNTADPNHPEVTEALIADAENAYNSTLAKIQQNRAEMGNADLLLNLPILMASNMVQFGNLYAGGYKTARKATNIAKKSGKYVPGSTKVGAVGSLIQSSISEGSEEVAQQLAADISGKYYEQDTESFHKSKMDPEAEQDSIDLVKLVGSTIAETMGKGDTWEQFTIGAMTGAMGMPIFRSTKNSEGNWQSPVTLEGGAKESYQEYRDNKNRETELADYMNERSQDPKFKAYYQGLVRHTKYQNDADLAVELNDEFNFKNASHSQLLSDINMFDNAGKLNDLREMIKDASDTSDENLQSILDNTTDESGNSPYKDLTKEEFTNKITKNKDKILKTIDSYRKIKDNLDVNFGDKLNDDQLEEMTWLISRQEDWKQRSNSLLEEIQPIIGTIAAETERSLGFYEGKTISKEDQEKINSLKFLSTKGAISSDELIGILESKNESITLSESLDALLQIISTNYNTGDFNFISKVKDLKKVTEAIQDSSKKISNYLANPSKLQEDLDSIDNEAVNEQAAKDISDIEAQISKATNVQELRQVLEDSPNQEVAISQLNQAVKNNNKIATEFKRIESYSKSVRDKLNNSQEEEINKELASQMFDEMFQSAESLQDIANPDNDVIINALMEGELGASRILLKAIADANNDQSFRDDFSGTYKSPRTFVEASSGKYKPVISSNSSNTPTGTSVAPISINLPSIDKPIGNITTGELVDDNKALKDAQELSPEQQKDREYIRPSIPEFNIYGAQAGDYVRLGDVENQQRLEDAYRKGRGWDPKTVNFKVIYDYLYNNGAFEYINLGKLKSGDDIHFMIDKNMVDSNGEPFIFLTTKDGQVIGSLDSSNYSVSRYKGLLSLRDRILKEYKINPQDKFVSQLTTKVAKIMVGSQDFGNKEQSLDAVLQETPMLGFIKNGAFFTNSKVSDSDIVKPRDILGKEGRLYLLSKRPDSKYGVSAVKVAHYNTAEIGANDSKISKSRFFNNMQNTINKIASSRDPGEIGQLKMELEKYLYLNKIRFDYFEGQTGSGLRITVPAIDALGNELYTQQDGKKIRVEEHKEIYYSQEEGEAIFNIGSEGLSAPTEANTKSQTETIAQQINEYLISLNLPFQVSGKNLNETLGAIKWNDLLSESGILTTNLVSPEYKNNWFVTDYYDYNSNKFMKAIPPTTTGLSSLSDFNPIIGGKDSAVGGTPIGDFYIQDNGDILDKNGAVVNPNNTQELKDLAYLQNTFGNRMNSSTMINGIVLLPSGKVYNRNTRTYATEKEASELKGILLKKDFAHKKAEVTLGRLRDDQSRVDKERTDSNFYYIKENDGEYHPYERVHSVIGSNWNESTETSQLLESIQAKLYTASTQGEEAYNKYLKNLEQFYSKGALDFSMYKGKMDTKSRQLIISTLRDQLNNTQSVRALKAGSAIDEVMRVFFNGETSVKPEIMTSAAYNGLLNSLNSIKQTMKSNGNGERFYTNNIVLFHNYNGKRVAGEVDILSVDNNGVFRIYDVKTSRYSFHDFIKNGRTYNYFRNSSKNQTRSQEAQYTLQLSSYQNLFQSHYGSPIGGLAILPYVLEYDENHKVSNITQEKGISITYSPTTEIPLQGTVAKVSSNTNSTIPIFNTQLNITDYKDILDDNNRTSDSKPGYYVKDGVVTKNYLKHIGTIEGVDIYMSKIAKISAGLGNASFQIGGTYDVVFSNGNSFPNIVKDSNNLPEKEIADKIMGALSKKSDKVKELASIKTSISQAYTQPMQEKKVKEGVTPATLNVSNIDNGAQASLAAQAQLQTPGLKKRPLDLKNRPKVNQPKAPAFATSGNILTNFQNTLQGTKEKPIFAKIDAGTKENLLRQGWTEENFNNVSKEEQEHALKCATL